jgi:hypothetical protein
MNHLISVIIIFLSFLININSHKFCIKKEQVLVKIELEKTTFERYENINAQIKITNNTKNDIRLPHYPEVSLLVNKIPEITNLHDADFYVELKIRNNKKWVYYNYKNYSEVYDDDTTGYSNNIIKLCTSESYNMCLLPAVLLPKNNYLIRIYFLAGNYCNCKNTYSNWVEFEVK